MAALIHLGSVPGGFVEWVAADTHESSYAQTLAAPEYWDLVDVIVVISTKHKTVTSQAGHSTARTSDLQLARLVGAQARFDAVRKAILERDFPTLAEVVELDSNLMHAVMMTSQPALFYWQPPSLTVMERVRQLRSDGLSVCYTLDAGPNVHCICLKKDQEQVSNGLKNIPGVLDILLAPVGGGAQVLKK